MQFDANVESETRRLLRELMLAVPGEFGGVLSSMVNLGPAAGGAQNGTDMKLGPLWWAPGVLALCCKAYGRTTERAVPVGVSLQLLGVAAGVLDSTQDHEIGRMGRHVSAGSNRGSGRHVTTQADVAKEADQIVALTLNAAVALIGLLWKALFEHGPRYGIEPSILVEIGKLLAELSIRTCSAQHLDLTARSATQLLSNPHAGASLNLEEYERLASEKSGELGGIVCEVAAVLAGAEEHRPLWRKLGVDWMTALQLKDDYIDLEEDLAAGRVSHSVLYGLEVADSVQKTRILSLLEAGRATGRIAGDARHELISLLESMGAAHYTLALLAVLRRQMLAALEALSLPSNEHTLMDAFVMSGVPEYGV